MSKAAQRKVSMFSSGLKDALNGLGFRWKRHANLRSYHAGFKEGKARLNGKVAKN